MLFPQLGDLLKSISKLQHSQVIAMPANDLNTHWQTALRECSRHRQGRVTCDRDVIAGFHPVDVGLHRDGADLQRVGLIHLERQHLADRHDDVLVGLHEFPQAMIQLRSLYLQLGQVGSAQGLALLDVPDDRIFQKFFMFAIFPDQTSFEAPCTPGFEDIIRV